VDLALGIAAAVVAALIFTGSITVQALEARAVSHEHAMRASLLKSLAARRRWLGAISLLVLGWVFYVFALTLAPLTVVQPVRAVGLLVLLWVGVRVLGERAGRRELVGVLLIVGGVVALGAAAPEHSSNHGSAGELLIALGLLGAAAVAPFALRGGDRGLSLLVVFAAGLAFSWVDFASKLMADALHHHQFLGAWAWVTAIGAFAVVGLLAENTSFQRRPATQVVPIVFALQMALPAALAALVGGENWGDTPLGGAVIGFALTLVTVGTLVLASSHAVADVVAAAEGAEEAEPAAA
jgi:drug/metabolite transporter (DMT)-like permease